MNMFPGPELYAGALFLTVLPAAYLIRAVWNRLSHPGARWLVLTLVGMSGWSVSWALMLLSDSYLASILSFNLVNLFVNVTTLGWLFMTVEYTWQSRVSYRIVVPFLIIPAIVQTLVWTNPIHQLVWGPGTTVGAEGVVNAEYGAGFFVHTGYSYLLVVASVVLLIVALVDREGLYRKQALLLLAGWLVPTLTSAAFVFWLFPTPYNPTPLGFLVGASIWGWALFRYQLLRTVPVARRMVLQEMDEGVLIVDECNVISDANGAARDMFGLSDDPTGKSLEAALAPHDELLAQLSDESVSDECVTLQLNGEQRHLLVNKSRVTHDSGTGGWVFVFNDQTALFRYEEDLELLKEVLSRVLRHDIRNKLNVIRAHGELLAQQSDGSRSQQARTIVRTADTVIETAEKAKGIESLVEADRPLYDIDLSDVAADTAEWATDTFPDAVVDLDVPAETWVRADEQLSLAVRSLVENALLHNDEETQYVRIRIEQHDDAATLSVEDNGPGLDTHERRIFEGESIDQLNHSTGLGLWLVKWVVRNSKGTVTVDLTDSGTRFEVTLNRGCPSHAEQSSTTGVSPGSM